MSETKIVLIGAGSVIFGLRMFQDLFFHRENLDGSEIVLVDIDQEKLDGMTQIARRLNQLAGTSYSIESTTDRVEALPGSDYVIISVEVERDRLWKLDWEIPRRHGVRHVYGENAGPGGLSHTLRTVPLVMEIGRDIERLSPDALVLNLTNPESRICMALSRYTDLNAVGLCHQIGEGYHIVAHILGLVNRAGPWPDNLLKQQESKHFLDIKAAGINHFTWMTDIREKASGRDLYPEFREAARRAPEDFHPMSRYLMEVSGLMLATGDGHAGELVGYAWEFVEEKGPDFELLEKRRQDFEQLMRDALDSKADLSEWLNGHSIERVVDFIAAHNGDLSSYELSANIVNHHCIENLPETAIVEVPVTVSGSGISGTQVGRLPEMIAAMCRQQVSIQELAVQAAVTGDRRAALQALLIDPVVPSTRVAEAVLDDILNTHAPYLPRFAP
jgi:alpha-galactosidase